VDFTYLTEQNYNKFRPGVENTRILETRLGLTILLQMPVPMLQCKGIKNFYSKYYVNWVAPLCEKAIIQAGNKRRTLEAKSVVNKAG
jgi:hypothetical protein